MQDINKKTYFKNKLGELIKEIRLSKGHSSLSKFAAEYEIDKGNYNRLEHGKHSVEFFTLWKVIESLNIDIVDFVMLLKQKLGDDFKIIDE